MRPGMVLDTSRYPRMGDEGPSETGWSPFWNRTLNPIVRTGFTGVGVH